MFTSQEDFSKASLGNIDAALRLGHVSLNGIERLVRLNLELSKQMLEDQVATVRELSGSKDPQIALQHLNKLAAQSVENAVSRSRTLYETLSETQSELVKLTEDNLSSLNKSLIGSIDRMAKNAPAGSDVAINAMKSGLAATAAAVNSITKAAQQVADFTEASVKAAGTATTDAVKNAARKANTSTH